jgi:AcrR family transcriptional regulator
VHSLNPPKQTRSRRTLERLVAASLEILDAEGPEGLTVQAVVTRAGSSVGSFYARFRGKDDLVDYLGERVWREAMDRWDEAVRARDWSEVDLGSLAQATVGLLIDAQRSRSSYLKALDRAAGGSDEAYGAFREHLLAGVTELFLGRRDEIEHPDPERAVRLGLFGVLGVLDGEATGGVASMSREELVAEATTLLLGYLCPRGSAGAGGEDVDFFDIWG